MREILFRGKRLDDGEWVEGYYLSDCARHAIAVSHSLVQGWELHEVDPSTVGQFAGLLDKHGKKIFDGDVVDYAHPFKNRTGRYVVRWQEYGFGCKGFYQAHYDEPSDAFSEGTSYFEVIGNIHDNPELLGGAE